MSFPYPGYDPVWTPRKYVDRFGELHNICTASSAELSEPCSRHTDRHILAGRPVEDGDGRGAPSFSMSRLQAVTLVAGGGVL